MNPQIAYLLNLSIQQIQSGRLEDAERSLKQVIQIQPKNADGLCFLSVIAAYKLQWQDALVLINKSLKLDPNNSVAHSNKGNILKELGQFEFALQSYKKAIQLDSNHFEAHNNLGNMYLDLGHYDQAISSYQKAIDIQPNYAEAYSNIGNALQKIGRYDDAIEMYKRATVIKPDYQDAWLNKGFALSKLKRLKDAIDSCNEAIQINPNSAKAWTDKGIILSENSQHLEAIEFYDRALMLNENYFEAWADRGSALQEIKMLEEALKSFQNAYQNKKNLPYLLGDIVALKLQMGHWDLLQEYLNEIRKALIDSQKIINPFKFLSIFDSPEMALEVAKIWVADRHPEKNILPKIQLKPHKKIRIGYFSADFRNHAVSFLTAELFELHDRGKFEIYAFSVRGAAQGDETRLRLKKAFDHFIDVEDKNDIEVAQISRDLEIDIAVDMGGHTQFAPTGVMSYRAAPIQVNYLGYPGTMGAKYIDYIIADKVLIPEEIQKFYIEKVAYLPDTYMVDDSLRVASDRVFTRSECGLPESGFIFCCFNNGYKFNKTMVESWSRILKATANSVIWISENNEIFRKNLINEFSNLGINGNRIIFAKKVDLMADHLARYKLADLFLDTNPYNAHTTAVDALKAGIPVLTLVGSAFAGRVAASLLNAIGLSELITNSVDEYESLAINIANDPKRTKDLKHKLMENQKNQALFDTKRFARNIEAAYIEMYMRSTEGRALDHIYV